MLPIAGVEPADPYGHNVPAERMRSDRDEKLARKNPPALKKSCWKRVLPPEGYWPVITTVRNASDAEVQNVADALDNVFFVLEDLAEFADHRELEALPLGPDHTAVSLLFDDAGFLQEDDVIAAELDCTALPVTDLHHANYGAGAGIKQGNGRMVYTSASIHNDSPS